MIVFTGLELGATPGPEMQEDSRVQQGCTRRVSNWTGTRIGGSHSPASYAIAQCLSDLDRSGSWSDTVFKVVADNAFRNLFDNSSWVLVWMYIEHASFEMSILIMYLLKRQLAEA
jgi:hypothetical protein